MDLVLATCAEGFNCGGEIMHQELSIGQDKVF